MSDLLKAGQKWLAEKLKKHASREITYRRGEVESIVTATIGKTMADQDTGDGLVLRMEIRDYLIDLADLKLDGQPTLPERGDLIIENDDGKNFTYEVG